MVNVQERVTPSVRARNRSTQMIVNQMKLGTRRRKRKELLLVQICLFGGLLMLVKGLTFVTEHAELDVVLEDHIVLWHSGRMREERESTQGQPPNESSPSDCSLRPGAEDAGADNTSMANMWI
ncbi:hypothetical protein NHX12_018710 [Muraenolepis orangiensis]|uniref:Uncharacterized protein n=1 Tax=Muraenolepis orangiensis TaxID=630683 RepID=A0A9Q0EWW5_9TELE|nr:hypothetical protein NHX12_018710 [Muraenolepis orangiensis]